MRKQAGRLLAGVAVAGVMAAAGTWSSAVQADTAQANVAVSASVAANCLVTGGSVSFGAYDPLGANESANLDASGSFSIRCTRGVTAQVGLGTGANYSAGRRMQSGSSGNYLGYELYSDSNRTVVWNNSTNRYGYTAANKSATSLTIYGRVPSGQDPVAGTYDDTVVAVAEF